MPTPNPDEETRQEFVDRCVPVVLDDGTTDDPDQAVAICSQMWEDATKGAKALEYKRLPLLDVKQIGEREFEGHAAVFGNVDLGGDVILAGSFKRSLNRHKRTGTWPPMFWMHQPDQVPGVWKRIEEDADGLYVKGELVDTQLGNETRTLLMKKAVRGLSIGYVPEAVDYDKDGNRLLKEIDLWEASIVSLAMNPAARVAAVKKLSLDDVRELRGILRDGGLSHTNCDRAVAALKQWRLRDAGAPDNTPCDEVVPELDSLLDFLAKDALEHEITKMRRLML